MPPKITVTAALQTARQRFLAAGCASPHLDAEVLLAHALNKTRTWLLTYPNHPLAEQQAHTFFALITRREQRQPVAYLTGHKEFFGLDFTITPDVLIPRPETELLVEQALQLAASIPRPTIVDVGTGSGCIAVTLARHLPQASLFAIDVSEPALAVARQNAAKHGVTDRINFLQGDLLAPLPQPVDLIASNPPYVSRPELRQTEPEVQHHEPRLALDGGEHGLEIIERLLAQSQKKLKADGAMLVEIGFAQGNSVKTLAQNRFPQASVQIMADLAGQDRLLIVKDLVSPA
jgi:release factor glutamine methyltransferase